MSGASRAAAGPPELADAHWADILAKISHDIRTPLNAVIGFADLMQRELHGALGNERYREYAGHIRDSGIDLLKAAEETMLLTVLLGSRGRLARETVALGECLDEVVRDVSRRAPLVDIDVCQPAVLDVVADRRALRLALRNLLSAVAEETPPHATLRLVAAAEHGVARLDVLVDVPNSDRLSPAHTATPASEAAVVLAGAVLRLQGAELIEGAAHASVRFTVLIESASQTDFFRLGD